MLLNLGLDLGASAKESLEIGWNDTLKNSSFLVCFFVNYG
jgi:hypothetical protein